MRKDKLGDRMKRYELEEGGRRMMPLLPIVVRMDGIAFHTFTKDLARPYCEEFSRCMIETTKYLVHRWHADLGYTQSDEISLYFRNNDPYVQMAYDGRYQKLVGAFASSVGVNFYKCVEKYLPQKVDSNPEWDCRVWQLPNLDEVFNMFLWRENDATTNSLSMAAQAHYPQKELFRKGREQLHEMLFQKGINWNNYPAFFKRGTYVRRVQINRPMSDLELSRVPEKHRHLHTESILRSTVTPIDMPPVRTFQSVEDEQFAQLRQLMMHVEPREIIA